MLIQMYEEIAIALAKGIGYAMAAVLGFIALGVIVLLGCKLMNR